MKTPPAKTWILIAWLCCGLPDLCRGFCPIGGVCDMQAWNQWGPCDSTCGGGTRTRDRPICCSDSHRDIYECVDHCGITDTSIFFDYLDCWVCQNEGTVDGGQCSCPERYTGVCCDHDVTCPQPTPPEHGSVRTPGGLTYGRWAEYSCDTDYAQAQGDIVRTCGAAAGGEGGQGQWSGQQPICLPADACIAENPCQHGATCHHVNSQYVCDCLPGFTGTYCQQAESIVESVEERPFREMSWHTHPYLDNVRKACFLKLVVQGSVPSYLSVEAASSSLGRLYGRHRQGLTVTSATSSNPRVMCLEYRCSGYVFTPEPEQREMNVEVTWQSDPDVTCTISETNPGLSSLVAATTSTSIQFTPPVGNNFGALYGVYTATGQHDVMRKIARTECENGRHLGTLGDDVSTKNPALTLTCQ